MKKIYLLLFVVLLTSCNTLKRAEKSMNKGNYVEAFDLLLEKYQHGVSEKKHKKLLPTFRAAYIKMVDSEKAKIKRYRLENNPAFYGDIYETLVALDYRQEALKALLPLKYKGRTVEFPISDYSADIVSAKSDYVDYLYEHSKKLLAGDDKPHIREAYQELETISQLKPGYADVEELMDDAHYRGIDFVLIDIDNRSNQIIPERLERDLTRMNTYELDDFWTQFHTQEQDQVSYDYLIKLDFEQIIVSPERINTVIHSFEKQVVDGWEYLYQNGNQVVDSLGNPIKVDKYITVHSEVEETFQEKDAMIDGMIELIYLPTNERVDYEKLNSEFAFRNHFIIVEGDERALDEEFRAIMPNSFMPFPPDEQMVYDCGEDIKKQLKTLLRRRF